MNGAVDRGDERMKGRGGAVGGSGDEDGRWRGRVVLREQKMEAEDERRVETCRSKGKEVGRGQCDVRTAGAK